MVGTRPARILVVDDVYFMRVVMRDILINSEIASEVYEASDGVEAIETYKKYRPDIVTMDIIMPRMDGTQAVREILKFDPRARIIMVTAKENRAAVQQAMKLGAQDYILKPLERAHIGPVFERVKRLRDNLYSFQ